MSPDGYLPALHRERVFRIRETGGIAPAGTEGAQGVWTLFSDRVRFLLEGCFLSLSGVGECGWERGLGPNQRCEGRRFRGLLGKPLGGEGIEGEGRFLSHNQVGNQLAGQGAQQNPIAEVPGGDIQVGDVRKAAYGR